MAQRYKVPQDVQREDQILWFITLRQLIILIVGFGISYWLFNFLNKVFILDEVSQVLVWVPAGLAAAFAFIRIKSVSLFKFILLLIEQNVFRPPRRRWSKSGGTPFVSMTIEFTEKKIKKSAKNTDGQAVSKEKIKNLANLLDGNQLPKKIKSHG